MLVWQKGPAHPTSNREHGPQDKSLEGSDTSPIPGGSFFSAAASSFALHVEVSPFPGFLYERPNSSQGKNPLCVTPEQSHSQTSIVALSCLLEHHWDDTGDT